jgi:hypothetical protein
LDAIQRERMTTKPKTRKAPPDPIFAAIAEHKALRKEWHRLNEKLDNAEGRASETHGCRPKSLIWWGDHDVFFEDHLDSRREKFLSEPGADREQVEKEYLDAKARLAAAERAGVEWDHRAGIAPLREQNERVNAAERRAATRLARTKPTTVAGAAVLLTYVVRLERVYGGFEGWEIHALRTAAAALTRIGAEAA